MESFKPHEVGGKEKQGGFFINLILTVLLILT
jgi:hypothetical protein